MKTSKPSDDKILYHVIVAALTYRMNHMNYDRLHPCIK